MGITRFLDRLTGVETVVEEAAPLPVGVVQGGNTAQVTSGGEIYTPETERERNVLNAYGRTMNSVSTVWTCFIDLSDTTNWPHDQTGRIDISTFSVTIDKTTNAQGSVTLGVITRVDGTNADITAFAGKSFTNSSDSSIDIYRNYSPSQLKLGVVGGKADKIATTAVFTNVAAVNTATPLDSFLGAGTVTPAVGDIVARFVLSSGTSYSAALQTLYHGEATA